MSDTASSQQASPVHIHVAAGSYNHVLYGFDVEIDPQGESASFVPMYSYESHVASVTSIGISGKVLVSGGADEFIKIYDLERQKEYGNLMQHTGTVTCLEFFESSHLLSAGEDGMILVWDAKSWDCIKILRGHEAPIDGLSIHPSGKLALSVDRSRTMQVWNLLKGRRAFVTKLPKSRNPCRIIKWFPSGDAYIVAVDSELLVYQTESGKVIRKINVGAQIHDIQFYKDDSQVVVASGMADIQIFDLKSGELTHKIINAHENRVRNITLIKLKKYYCVISSSNDGFVKAWRLPRKFNKELSKETHEPLGLTKTAARLSCMIAQQHVAGGIAEIYSDVEGLPTLESSHPKKQLRKKRKRAEANLTEGAPTAAPTKKKTTGTESERKPTSKSGASEVVSIKSKKGKGDLALSKSQLKKAKAKALKAKKAEDKDKKFEIVAASEPGQLLQPFDESSSDDEYAYEGYGDDSDEDNETSD